MKRGISSSERAERRALRRALKNKNRTKSLYSSADFPKRKRGYKRTHFLTIDETGNYTSRVTMVKNLDSDGGFSLKILRFILLFLVVVALFDFANGSEQYVTFSSFLQAISDAPKLDTSWIRGVSFSLGDWGVFNVFRNLVNSLLSIIRMGLYLAVGVGQLIVFIGFILSSFFMIA